jgi:hypothetical protein
MAGLIVAGCSDGGAVGEGTDTPNGSMSDTPQASETDGPIDPPPDTPMGVQALEFDLRDGLGDDGQPCVGTPACVVAFSFPATRTVTAVYTEDGVPVAGKTVRAEVVACSDVFGVAVLSDTDMVTDEAGRVSLTLGVADGGEWTFSVAMSADGAPGRTLNARVTVFNPLPLRVEVRSTGTSGVDQYDVFLYRQSAGVPDCSDPLGLFASVTADRSAGPLDLRQAAAFTDFPGLEADGEQRYTVVARASRSGEPTSAVGCDATQGRVRWVAPTSVVLDLTDL